MPEISYEEAEKLLRKYVKDKELLRHSAAVSKYVYEISLGIKKRHPELKIDPEKLRVAGLLHDIGKDLGKSHLHHINGGRLLRSLGYPEIAGIIEKHTFAKEASEYENISGNFEPKTLEEKLLTYADAHVIFRPVSFEERMKNIEERRRRRNPETLKIIETGKPRIVKILKEVEKLLGEEDE